MPVFSDSVGRKLLEHVWLYESAKIDAKWIKDVRKSWKKVLEPVKKLADRSPHNETKIDMEKLYRTADTSLAALGKVLEFIIDLRQDLLLNKGLWTVSKLEKGEGGRNKPAAKTVQELHTAEWAIRDEISRIKDWKGMMTPGEHSHRLDGGQRYQAALTDLVAFNRMLNSVSPYGFDIPWGGIAVADRAVSNKLFGTLSYWIKLFGTAYELTPIEPQVVKLGKMAVIFQDTPEGSPFTLKAAGQVSGKWRVPQLRKPYLRWMLRAMYLLKRHGLDHLWYGKVFVLPSAAAPENMHGSHWGVGGDYSRAKDVIRVFSDPSEFISELLIHELGHRYWFKFMSTQERHNFGRWFGKVPAVTDYGKIDSPEDFAEVFAHYVVGKHLTKAQVQRLRTFFGRTRKLEDIRSRFYDLRRLRLA